MTRTSFSPRSTSARAVLTAALAVMTLLSSSAWAQNDEAPPDEEPLYEEAILEEGPGWQLKEIRGTVLDDQTKTYKAYDAFVYSLKPEGISGVPLPSDIKEALIIESEDNTDTVYTLNQTILQEIEISRDQGYLTETLEALAEPGEGMLKGGPVLLGSCSDQIHTRSKSLGFNTPLNFSGNLGGGFSGSLSATGNLSGSATGQVQFAVKRTRVLGVCIPYGARFNHARAFGNAVVGYGAALNGNINYNYTWQTQVAKPSLGGLSFMIGPVPVYIGFNLPINLGVDVQASVTGNINYNGSQSATGSFDYTCTLSGCSGNSSYNLGGNQQQTLTGNVSGRVYPTIWAQAAVRAFLYTEAVAYAQVGVRPYLYGDLWGYAGNNCGDADGDGLQEMVNALTFNLDWQLYLTAQASAFGSAPTHWNLWNTPRTHIRFWDLIGSSAIRPMISGPSNPKVNVSQTYSAKMRPCWPYTHTVNYRFAWGDGSTTTLSGSPQTWTPSSHTWTSTGTKAMSLTALSDSYGRSLNQATTRNIQVVP
jgi:hypothetical protein